MAALYSANIAAISSPTSSTDLEAATKVAAPKASPSPRRGYASLADFIASDKDFQIFRRFDSLAFRQLLYMQAELCELEEQIKDLDDGDVDNGRTYGLHTREDGNAQRLALIEESKGKLKEYEETLLRRSQLMALSKPVDRNITSLANWVDGVKPVVAEESGFLHNRADLAPLSAQDSNPLEHFMSRYLYKIFVTKKHEARSKGIPGPATIHYFSATTIRTTVRLLVMLIAVVVMTSPTFALYAVKSTVVRLALIVVFAMAFALVLVIMTDCKNQEMFALIAAYTAVLIVFVGNDVALKK